MTRQHPEKTTIASVMRDGACGVLIISTDTTGKETLWQDGPAAWVEVLHSAMHFWREIANKPAPRLAPRQGFRVVLDDVMVRVYRTTHRTTGDVYVVAMAYPPNHPITKQFARTATSMVHGLTEPVVESSPPETGL